MSNSVGIGIETLSDAEIQLLAAELSALAYEDEAMIKDEIKNFSSQGCQVHFFRGTHVFGFVAKLRGVAFIVFRGSQTIGDWINNFDCRTVNTFCGNIHRGFANALNSISRDTLHRIVATFDQPYKLYLAGHSRGGSLAVLAAAVLQHNGYEPTAIFTFGSPKVGGKQFIEWWDTNMKAEFFRYVNNLDPVPYLPPSSFEDFFFLSLSVLKMVVNNFIWAIVSPFRLLDRARRILFRSCGQPKEPM